MENPFKFGTLVDNEYFTDRVAEQQHIRSMLDSPNHIVLISPRRFGKSSLVKKVVRESGRPFIALNMQQAPESPIVYILYNIPGSSTNPCPDAYHLLHIQNTRRS